MLRGVLMSDRIADIVGLSDEPGEIVALLLDILGWKVRRYESFNEIVGLSRLTFVDEASCLPADIQRLSALKNSDQTIVLAQRQPITPYFDTLERSAAIVIQLPIDISDLEEIIMSA